MSKYQFEQWQPVKTDLGYEGQIIKRTCSIFTLFKPKYIIRIQKINQNTGKMGFENIICTENQLEALLKKDVKLS